MNANEMMKKALAETNNEIEGNHEGIKKGFSKTMNELKAKIEDGMDSTLLIPYVNERSYITFNLVEDLKEEGATEEEIDMLLGEYTGYETFLNKFYVWLSSQDFQTMVMHSVNEEASLKDDANLSLLNKFDNNNMGRKLSFALKVFFIRGYEKDKSGNIESVTLEISNGNKEVFKYEEFKSLFNIDRIHYLEEEN